MSGVGRRIWAVFDAALLLYLVSNYDWSLSIGGTGLWIMLPVEAAFDAVRLGLMAACFGVAALAIGREFRREPDLAPFPFRVIARPLLVAALLGAVGVWILVWSGLSGADGSGTAGLFGWLTAASHRVALRAPYRMFGLAGYADGSVGGFLVALLAAAYLAEKSLRLTRSVGRPRHALTLFPITPVLLVGLAVLPAIKAEQVPRAWVRSQEWAMLPEVLTFPDAVVGCERQGPGWRLPNDAELAHYFSANPAPTPGVQGKAWTNTLTEMGSTALAVAFSPLAGGASPYRCAEETHDPDWLARDGFSRMRGWACGRFDSPTRHARTRTPLAALSATSVEPVRLPTVCIRPTEPALDRFWPPERNETTITTAAQWSETLRARCAEANRPPATCAAFASETSAARVGGGVSLPFFAIEQQFEAATIVFEGLVVQIGSEAGRSTLQVAARRYFKGNGPPFLVLEGVPPEQAGIAPQTDRLFFATTTSAGTWRLIDNGIVEVTAETLAAIAPKLGPGAPPPIMAGSGTRRLPPAAP